MFELENISVSELFSLKDEVLFKKYMRFSDEEDVFYLNPKGFFAGNEATPLGKLQFGEVANIKMNLSEPTFESVYECFDLIFRVKMNTYLRQDVISYIYALNWIKDEIKKLSEREKNAFAGGEIDPILEMAGVKRLTPFGELNSIIPIAQKYGKSPAEVETWKYNLVFSLMLHDKVSNEIQLSYNELKYGSKKQA